MAQVTIHLNDKPYTVGCEDGQERHLLSLAALFDTQVRQVSQSVGLLSDTRLFLMAALMMADELADTQARLAQSRSELGQLRSGRSGAEERAAGALDAAARRIEALAGRIDADTP